MKFDSSEFLKTNSDDQSFIYIDCNVLAANIDSYSDTRLYEWLSKYSELFPSVSKPHLIANIILRDLFAECSFILNGTDCSYSLCGIEYDLSYFDEEIEIALRGNSQNCEKVILSVLEIILNGPIPGEKLENFSCG